MSKLFNNTTSLNEILEAIQNKAAGSGGGIPTITLPVGASEIQLQPNKYYILTQPVATNLSLSLLSGQDGELSEYMLEIRADEDDINISFSESIQWNEAKNLYNIKETSVSLEGRYTHYLSIIDNKGLSGATVNKKLANTTITYDETTLKLSWTAVENAEWYEVYVADPEISNFQIYNETFTSVPSGGVVIPGFNPANHMADGYVKACSQYYTDSKTTWSH